MDFLIGKEKKKDDENMLTKIKKMFKGKKEHG